MTLKKTRLAVLVPAVAALALVAVLGRPASAAERSLAGVKIFSTTSAVLQKYGNPTQVIVGLPTLTASISAPGATGSGSSSAAPSTPGALPPLGGLGNALNTVMNGGVPSELGGQGVPGGGAAPNAATGANGSAGANGGANAADNGEVTWVYDRPGGIGLEFTMSADGRVIQIRATGSKGSVRTARGIGLGDPYGKVIGKYGYPESQEQQGVILNAHYEEKAHATFQFYNQRLVGIIVAAVE